MTEYRYAGEELEVFARARNWKGYLAALLQPFVCGRVLEVGAGIGATTRALWHDGVASWTCLEPDARLAARLRPLRFGLARRAPRVLVGDLSALPPGERFDTILYVDVLEHIPDDRAELARAAEHLAPGGHLVVLAPAYPFLYSQFDRALGHERRYTARALAAAFPPTLERVRLLHADSAGALASLANRLVLRQRMPRPRQVRFWDRVLVPASRLVDPLVRHAVGRSVIAVYRRESAHVPYP